MFVDTAASQYGLLYPAERRRQTYNVRFYIFTAVSTKITAIWDMVSLRLVDVKPYSQRCILSLHLQGDE
jgi:hypothetical protein